MPMNRCPPLLLVGGEVGIRPPSRDALRRDLIVSVGQPSRVGGVSSLGLPPVARSRMQASEGWLACQPKLGASALQSAFALRGTADNLRASSERRLAERVGFAPVLRIENKELKGFRLPHDPTDPHESRGRDTY